MLLRHPVIFVSFFSFTKQIAIKSRCLFIYRWSRIVVGVFFSLNPHAQKEDTAQSLAPNTMSHITKENTSS